MFELEKAINGWRREMQSRGIKTAETLDELESHLRDDLEEQVRSGMPIQQAFDMARAHFGTTGSLETEFEKIRFTELYHRWKNALLTFIGVPNCNLITNMNASYPSSNLEAKWASYIKAGTFLAPSLVLWMFSCLFMMPKLKQICENAGLALPNVFGFALFATSHLVLISAALLTSLILLEWRSNKWPRFRRVTLSTGVFIINAFILLLITLMVFSALTAAPAMAHSPK